MALYLSAKLTKTQSFRLVFRLFCPLGNFKKRGSTTNRDQDYTNPYLPIHVPSVRQVFEAGEERATELTQQAVSIWRRPLRKPNFVRKSPWWSVTCLVLCEACWMPDWIKKTIWNSLFSVSHIRSRKEKSMAVNDNSTAQLFTRDSSHIIRYCLSILHWPIRCLVTDLH